MLSLNVVTPQKDFLTTMCKSVLLNTADGQVEILDGHANLLSKMLAGMVSYTLEDGSKHSFEAGEGVLKVLSNKVVLMCDSANEVQ